jgi:hypothetical protein
VKLITQRGLVPKLRLIGGTPVVVVVVVPLQPYVSFGLLHHIIPGFAILNEPDPISHF